MVHCLLFDKDPKIIVSNLNLSWIKNMRNPVLRWEKISEHKYQLTGKFILVRYFCHRSYLRLGYLSPSQLLSFSVFLTDRDETVIDLQ